MSKQLQSDKRISTYSKGNTYQTFCSFPNLWKPKNYLASLCLQSQLDTNLIAFTFFNKDHFLIYLKKGFLNTLNIYFIYISLCFSSMCCEYTQDFLSMYVYRVMYMFSLVNRCTCQCWTPWLPYSLSILSFILFHYYF